MENKCKNMRTYIIVAIEYPEDCTYVRGRIYVSLDNKNRGM